MRLSELLVYVPNILNIGAVNADPEVVAPVVEDSRMVEPGGIFVARSGLSVDGHTYIAAAVDRGAVAVFGECLPVDVDCRVPYIQVVDGGLALAYLAAAQAGFPARNLVMIGVTGTDGKTTTSNLIFSILKSAGIKSGMISTVSAVLGDEEMDTGLHVTTPTSPDVQAYLSRMVKAGLTHCVLEATSHGLAQHRVAACDFDVAVVTNIQHEHLDFHGTWEHYRDAKAMLFRNLMAGTRKAQFTDKLAVINLDDAPSADYLRAIPADRHLCYAITGRPGAQVFARKIHYGASSTRLVVSIDGCQSLVIESALVGEFNVSNMLAAVAVARGLGISTGAIKAGIEAIKGVPGRMERIDEGQEFPAIVDFAHTPNALQRALEAARLMIPPTGRVIVVFGCAGLRDPEKRVMMGHIAAHLADLTVITAEDPRTESLDVIMAATAAACIEKGGIEGETFWRVPDRGEAILKAVQMAQVGDVVISCGKGHEQSMCFGTVEYPWDDRRAMRAALRGEPLRTLPTASQ
ncbi:MAG: UDP-N-acetylmuramoyl-L-alanyl-D-glutamate--2,6-diaminopimelate ligase [Anaerolineae bacterium]|nr:UDP-N-acetylmuramoyl-L-alanyl-D-glutamate--2,6-diaminopimelate ligase [Anaerolineae bacterium]